ncbi:MAG: hypothetical protein LBH44_07535 [Treponema sp.]|nr:hypothetical protein [Treponema sp.]
MNITSVKCKAFANGFNYFCEECNNFFSVQFEEGGTGTVEVCPYCGEDRLAVSIKRLLEYCADNGADPVNFYHAFPPDEPIPNSRTGATRRQVEWIIGCVINDKQKKFPVTVESMAIQLGYDQEVVRKVFEELHITETGGES